MKMLLFISLTQEKGVSTGKVGVNLAQAEWTRKKKCEPGFWGINQENSNFYLSTCENLINFRWEKWLFSSVNPTRRILSFEIHEIILRPINFQIVFMRLLYARIGAMLLLTFCLQACQEVETSQTPPQSLNMVQAFPDLFPDVQMAGIFPDSKTFADCTPKNTPLEVNVGFIFKPVEER